MAGEEARARRSRTPFDPAKKHVPTMLTTDLVAAVRPGLREDLAPLHGKSGPVRRRLRPRLVQADASRHGPARPLSRSARAERRADLAGPDPGGRSSAGRRAGHRRAEGEDPRLRPLGRRNSSRPPGRRHRPSAAPTSAAAPTARASVSRRRRTGRSTSRRSWHGAGEARSDPDGVQRLGSRRQEGLARRPDRPRRRRGDREGGEGCRRRRDGPVPPGRMDASQEQTDVQSFAPLEPRADGFRNYVNAASCSSCRQRRRWWTGRNCCG